MRQLAQLRPTTTSAEVLFAPTQYRPYEVSLLNIANVSGAAVDISVFHDANGTTYDESTALLWNVNLNAGSTMQIEAPISDYQLAGRIAVKVSAANAATFTLYGEVTGERL